MPKSPHSFAQGFTLVEILIAVVVLSFGLLGLAGLQAAGIKSTQSANLRTLAVQQAYDMLTGRKAVATALSAAAAVQQYYGAPLSATQ